MTRIELPTWLAAIAERVAHHAELPLAELMRSRAVPADEGMPAGKRSSVLILFGEGPQGPDLLLIRRATWLRKHAGQPAFPGGGVESGDADPIATALREAQEETGLDPAGVVVLGSLAELWLPISNGMVTPVVAWWRVPSEVYVADPAEIEAVVRVPLRELTDPRARGIVSVPRGPTPAFEVGDMVIWGFTGLIIDNLLRWLGLEQPWDQRREVELPPGDSGPLTVTV